MKKNFLAVLAAGCLLSVQIGCVGTVDGRRHAAVPLVKDTIEGRYERPVAQIFQAAKEVLRFNGTLVGENTINNSLEAKVDTRTVWVAVDEIGPQTSRVRVQCRKKGGAADIDLAAEVDKQIALKLK